MRSKAENKATVRLQKEDGFAIVTLNRPNHMNALSRRMIDLDFPQVIQTVAVDDDIRTIILTGAGEAFCAGGDMKEVLEDRASGLRIFKTRHQSLQPLSHLVLQLRKLKKPIIGAINGMAAGGGFSLATACDIRIASEKARFCSVFIKRGLIPDYGLTYFLPRIVGIARALEWMLSGEVVDIQDAKNTGLISKVVPHGKLMEECTKLAKKLANGPPIAIELTKLAVYKGLDNDLETQADFESYAQNLCFNSEDFKEGVSSFLEKRKPIFKGK